MFGVRPVTVSAYATAPLPLPRLVPPLAGTRVPNMSSQVIGFVELNRNQPVEASRFGLAEPLNVTEVSLFAVTAFVVTVGTVAVTKLVTAPNETPAEFEASAPV